MEKQAMMTDSKKKKEAEIDEKRKAVGPNLFVFGAFNLNLHGT